MSQPNKDEDHDTAGTQTTQFIHVAKKIQWGKELT